MAGLHCNTLRYYDPDTGRFISPDPIGPAGGLNLYQYAPNPVSWIDPLGSMCGPKEANSQSRKVALGKDIAGGGMKGVAEKTGSSWYKNWARDGITRRTVTNRFGRAFHQAVARADEIHFSLDGIPDPAAAVKAGAAGFVQKTGNMTNAELNYIAHQSGYFVQNYILSE